MEKAEPSFFNKRKKKERKFARQYGNTKGDVSEEWFLIAMQAE